MNITSSIIRPKSLPQTPVQRHTTPQASESFTFSGGSRKESLLRGLGGGLAGAAFSGVLLSLPLSLAPAFGVDVQTALTAYKTAVVTAGVAGGLASASLPPKKNWY